MSETSSVSLEKIYKAYEDIDAAGNDEESLAKVKGSYEALIAAAHAESNCKRLAAQFIPRFFGKFPDFHETAIDALFDLCEDQDLNVRLTVIKHLPNVVKESKKYSLRITDALVQLLQNGSSQELLVVKKAIEQVIRIDPQASLRFIIQQAIVGSTEVKKHTINFLSVDLNKFKNELFDQHKDLEQFLADEIQKVLHEAEFFELEIFISMLSSLKVYENNKSKLQDLSKSLINAIVTEKETFDPNDENFFQKFVLSWYLVGSPGVLPQSDTEAYLWAKRAADKGLPKAEYAVGYFTEVGIGVKKDQLEANIWYRRAAEHGDKKAQQKLKGIPIDDNKKKKDDCVIS
ncbi:15623_t:CDS:2 [Entrophospora sp. SA101]|nr:15623_t:CDS:2 [Entrophospora sp. SA101]